MPISQIEKAVIAQEFLQNAKESDVIVNKNGTFKLVKVKETERMHDLGVIIVRNI